LRNIKKDASNETIETEITNAMSTVPVQAVQNKQAVIPKSIVPDLGWFDRDRTKFKD